MAQNYDYIHSIPAHFSAFISIISSCIDKAMDSMSKRAAVKCKCYLFSTAERTKLFLIQHFIFFIYDSYTIYLLTHEI